MADFSPTTVARFWSKVDVSDDTACWNWRAGKNEKGYGKFTCGGKTHKSHRIAYKMFGMQIDDGLILRHKCDNPSCCNPMHLTPGTAKDNINDCTERGRRNDVTRDTSYNAKLTTEQIDYIRKNPDQLTGVVMAKKFGVAESTISYVRSYRKGGYGKSGG